jgi:predicted flap endonuclease-1-like 5' DNA nuclease
MLANLTPLARFAESALDARQAAMQRAADMLGDGALRVVAMQARFGAASLAVARHWWFGDAPAAAPAPVAAPVAAAKPAAAPKPAARKAAEAPAPVEAVVIAPDVVPEVPPAPAPATVVEPAAAAGPVLYAEAPADADDLTALKGIGPKLSAVLNALGVHTFAQIAAWTPDDIVWVEDKLDFRGRVTREKWVEQAAAKLA